MYCLQGRRINLPCPCGAKRCLTGVFIKMTVLDNELGLHEKFNWRKRDTHFCSFTRADLAAARCR